MNYAFVGVFVLLLGAALVAGVLWLASGGALRKQYDLYLAIEDESVSGLNLDAPVNYNGVRVGKVRAIALDPVDPQRVRLTFAIEHGTPIKRDTLAVLETQGLTGTAHVELSGGAPGAPLLRATGEAPYPVIRTRPSLGARLENVLTHALAKLDRTTSNIDEFLSAGNRAAFSATLTDLAAVSHTLATRRNSLDEGITSATRTLRQVDRASDHLDLVLTRIGGAARAVETMGTRGALAGATAGRTIDAVGTDVQQILADTGPRLERLLGELDRLSASLRRISEQAERSPASLLVGRGPIREGPGEVSTRARGP